MSKGVSGFWGKYGKLALLMLGLVISVILIWFVVSTQSSPPVPIEYSTHPMTNAGKKWRVGYLEGGYYPNYAVVFKQTLKSLQQLGWLGNVPFANFTDQQDSRKLWVWLADHADSPYLEFVKDGYWSANWDKVHRLSNQQAVIARLNRQQDIDLMLALGTWAGQDLANHLHNTPTIVLSSSDPLASNIIKSAQDSGYNHLHAKIDLFRYERQIKMFYRITPFKSLGVVYEDSLEGRSYAGLEAIKKIAEQKNFAIVSCYANFSTSELSEAERDVAQCYTELAAQVDAIYLTHHRGLTTNNVSHIVQAVIAHKVPTFSQQGTHDVKAGVLLSLSLSSRHTAFGQFHAETIAKIFNGARPRDLPLQYEEPMRVSINIATARLIGFSPPPEIFAMADEIFYEIPGYEVDLNHSVEQ